MKQAVTCGSNRDLEMQKEKYRLTESEVFILRL